MTPTHRLSIAAMLFTVLCAACVRAPVDRLAWPEDLPPLNYYEREYQRDQSNQSVQSKEDYLKWVRRFYRGWNLYPDGWNDTTRDILLGVEDDNVRERLRKKLAHLGKLISAEWAKSADDRAIRSRELSVWGQALLKAVNANEEERLVDRVTGDVNALLSRRLDPTDVSLKRYYEAPSEVYEVE